MTSRTIVGLDIGGANLKAARLSPPDIRCQTVPFPLWRQPGELASALGNLLRSLDPVEELAITMTGELCDCFRTRREGVLHILGAVEAVAQGRPCQVWTTEERFVELHSARSAPPLTIAASNWLALASWAGRLLPQGSGLLLDIGSTTTDIIPLAEGRPAPRTRDDSTRLLAGELVYRGVRRTPVCALTEPLDDVAAELFATTLDVFLVLGDIPSNPADTDTADGRPATREDALIRLNRMFCLDADAVQESALVPFARTLRGRLLQHLEQCVQEQLRHLGRSLRGVVLAGSGEFLGRQVLTRLTVLEGVPVWSLQERLGIEVSTAACAHAVAVLAREGKHTGEQET